MKVCIFLGACIISLFLFGEVPLAADPSRDTSGLHFQAGLDAAHKEQWSVAIAEFSAVIDSREDAASLCAAHINRGRAKLLSDDLEGSIADFNAALSVSPNSAEALTWRASYWAAKGDKTKAIADCTQAIAIDPKWAPAYVRRGTALGSLKQYVQANEDFSVALKIKSDDISALVGRGLAREQLSDIAGAIADIDKALVIDPSLARVKVVRERLGSKLNPSGLTSR